MSVASGNTLRVATLAQQCASLRYNLTRPDLAVTAPTTFQAELPIGSTQQSMLCAAAKTVARQRKLHSTVELQLLWNDSICGMAARAEEKLGAQRISDFVQAIGKLSDRGSVMGRRGLLLPLEVPSER